MKTLSLWQPWASAIALGHKQIETRGWGTPYRGPIAIHAARTTVEGRREVVGDLELWREVLGVRGAHGVVAAFEALPFGAVVAIADLIDVVPVDGLVDLAPKEFALGDYRHGIGRFAWLLDCVRPLPKPIPMRGRQGLFEVQLEWTPA